MNWLGSCLKWDTVHHNICPGKVHMLQWMGSALCDVSEIWIKLQQLLVNTLRPRRNGQHFANDIFKHIFFHENVWISITISLEFVPKGPINNILALVQIMAWRRPGDKPLSEPLLVSLLTHICVTRPQWVKEMHSVIDYVMSLLLKCFKCVSSFKATSCRNISHVHLGSNRVLSVSGHVS